MSQTGRHTTLSMTMNFFRCPFLAWGPRHMPKSQNLGVSLGRAGVPPIKMKIDHESTLGEWAIPILFHSFPLAWTTLAGLQYPRIQIIWGGEVEVILRVVLTCKRRLKFLKSECITPGNELKLRGWG